MSKFLAVLQIIAAILLAVLALATLVNLALISTRPETISVVNAMVGQGVVIVCLAAASNIIFRRGLEKYRQASSNPAASDDQAG
jgi:membrane protein implicated in regulation of membrane protease activity